MGPDRETGAAIEFICDTQLYEETPPAGLDSAVKTPRQRFIDLKLPQNRRAVTQSSCGIHVTDGYIETMRRVEIP